LSYEKTAASLILAKEDVAKEYIDEKDIWQEETEATPAAEVAAGRKRKSSHRWWDECR
jgi:hypothetical protein